jgi:hypothetical protein
VSVNACKYDGKTLFRTYRIAQKTSRKLPQPGRIYWCAIGGGYHVARSTRAEYDRRQAQGGEAS